MRLSKYYLAILHRSILGIFGISILMCASAISASNGHGFSAETPQELLEKQLHEKWQFAEEWPDLVVLYQGKSQAFDGPGFDYLLLEVNDHTLCWDSALGQLRKDQLVPLDRSESQSPACMVSSIQRLETPQALPLKNGGYSRTRLVSLPVFGVAMLMSTTETVRWVVRQDSPMPVSIVDVLESISVVATQDLSEVDVLELNFNLARTSPAEVIPLIQVFSPKDDVLAQMELDSQSDCGPENASPQFFNRCNTCNHGGVGAISCGCSNYWGYTCDTVCGSGYACCTCRDFLSSYCICCGGSSGGGGTPPPEPDPPPPPGDEEDH